MCKLLNDLIKDWKVQTDFNKDEFSPSRWGALNLFRQQTNQPDSIVTPELIKKAKESFGKPMVEFEFVPLMWDFSLIPIKYKNDEAGYRREFNNKMKEGLLNVADKLDKMAAEYFIHNCSTICTNPLNYKWISENKEYYLQASYSEKENLLRDIKLVMQANGFYKGISLIGGPALRYLYNGLPDDAKQGVSSSYFTNNLGAEDAINYMYFYAVQDASVALITRIGPKEKIGGIEWDQQKFPIIEMDVGTCYVNADEQYFRFSMEVCFTSAYVSRYDKELDGKLSVPIVKFAIKREEQ